MATNSVAIELREVVKHFPLRRPLLRRGSAGAVHAVDGVNLSVASGRTLGLVGESGSGKSTLARLIVHLEIPTSGSLIFNGEDVTYPDRRHLHRLRRQIQIVFQDPYSSFDPQTTIADSIAEPLRTFRLAPSATERDDRLASLFHLVGLSTALLRRSPSQLSGGQLQRAAVARALAVEPSVLVLDEPVSALDVSTQAVLINLLEDLQAELGITYVLIGHDLSVVRHASHRIAVMYLGRIVEQGPADQICAAPRHPYTQALLSAVPVPHPRIQRTRPRVLLPGEVPSPIDPPTGCRFHTRCPKAMAVCAAVDPGPHTVGTSTSWCHLHHTSNGVEGTMR